MPINDLLFWTGGVGVGLVLPAVMFWHRRSCLADERFPKGADGQGVFAGESVTKADQALLMQWQRRMVTGFVAGMALWPLIVLGALAWDVSQSDLAGYAFLALLFLVLFPFAYLQFSAKCPCCQYRIGLQPRLLLPQSCERCGVSFRQRVGEAAH